MKEEVQKDNKSAGFTFKQLFNIPTSNNLAILREEEMKVSTDQCKQYKDAFQNSIFTLLFNLLGLSAINMKRGMNPALHQARYKWSKPIHLSFLISTGINLCMTTYLGYSYVSKAPKQVKQIMELAKDPRIYMDVDKVKIHQHVNIKQAQRIEIVHGTIKQKLMQKQ